MDSKFVLKLIGLTGVLALATFAFLYFSGVGEENWFWGALGFYLVVGLFIGWRSNRAVLSDSNSAFFTGVMGGTGLRMLFCLVFLAIYLVMSEIKSREFIVYYLFLYLFFTIFEISQLVSKLRAEKRSSLDNTTS